MLLDVLNNHNIKICLTFKRYDPDLYNQVIFKESHDLNLQTNVLQTGQSKWQIETTVKQNKDNYSFKSTLKLIENSFKNGSVSISFNFQSWDRSNYVLIPAAAYNGNRFKSRKIPYSPKLIDPEDINKQSPIIISDVPRLNIAEGPSHIQIVSGATSDFGCNVYSQKENYMFCLNGIYTASHGDLMIDIEENRTRTRAIISITTPCVRELYKYRITDNQFPSDDIPLNLHAGEQLEFDFSFGLHEADSLHKLFENLKNNRHTKSVTFPTQYQLPMSGCYEVIRDKFDRLNWNEAHGYYSVGMKNGKYPYLQDWQTGWTGGMISTYPLLVNGTNITIQNCIRNIDWFFEGGISPSGFFYDSGEKGTQWYGGDPRKPHTHHWHLIRKSGDAAYYILKLFFVMQKRALSVKNHWETQLKKVLDCFVKLWEDNRQIGQFIHSETGEIVVGGSTSGAIIPAALILASRYYGHAKYATVATEIADYYYTNYVQAGIACGGPGDALQNPDSESAYALLESFCQVYEYNRTSIWKSRAIEAGNLFLTWVMTYNYEMPADSFLGKLNLPTLGAVFANTQNKHGAPGICTYSGNALLKLYRITNDPVYARVLQQIIQLQPFYLSHPAKPIPNLEFGFISERINTNDWFEGTGEMMFGSTWAETSLMLAYTECPQVYVNTDSGLIACFDHLEASWKVEGVEISILNPTKFALKAKIMVENAALQDLAYNESKICDIKAVIIPAMEKININLSQF